MGAWLGGSGEAPRSLARGGRATFPLSQGSDLLRMRGPASAWGPITHAHPSRRALLQQRR